MVTKSKNDARLRSEVKLCFLYMRGAFKFPKRLRIAEISFRFVHDIKISDCNADARFRMLLENIMWWSVSDGVPVHTVNSR